MLGGHFSSSGKIVVETWLLKQAGFIAHSSITSIAYDGEAEENITKVMIKLRGPFLIFAVISSICLFSQKLLKTAKLFFSCRNTSFFSQHH